MLKMHFIHFPKKYRKTQKQNIKTNKTERHIKHKERHNIYTHKEKQRDTYMVEECSKCILFISLFSALIFSQLWQSQDDDSSDELSDLDLSDLDLSDFELSEHEESELEEVSEEDEEDVDRMSSGCDFDIFVFF
jgi:hypothetical protein